MITVLQEDSLVKRVLSNLFPPQLGQVNLSLTLEYQERLSRKGVHNKRGEFVGRVVGKAKEKA